MRGPSVQHGCHRGHRTERVAELDAASDVDCGIDVDALEHHMHVPAQLIAGARWLRSPTVERVAIRGRLGLPGTPIDDDRLRLVIEHDVDGGRIAGGHRAFRCELLARARMFADTHL